MTEEGVLRLEGMLRDTKFSTGMLGLVAQEGEPWCASCGGWPAHFAPPQSLSHRIPPSSAFPPSLCPLPTEKVQKEYNQLNEKVQKLHHDLEEQIHTNTQLLAENSQKQVGLHASMYGFVCMLGVGSPCSQ